MRWVVVTWAVYTFLVHTVAGHVFVLRPLLRDQGLRPLSRTTLEVLWHFSTFCLALMAIGIAYGATNAPVVLELVAAELTGIVALFLWLGPRRLGSGLALPQWMLLGPLLVGVVCLRFELTWTAPLLIAAIGAVHVAWALGVSWPAPSRHEAPAYLIGRPVGARFPGRAATLAVGVLAFAVAAGAYAGIRWIITLCAAVLLARGITGLFASRIFPAIRGTPFANLNLGFYSPLCLFIGALLLVSR